MVIAKREIDKSFSSDFSRKYVVPPWCSSSRTYVGKRKVVPRRDMKSYPIQNIWLNEEKRNINKRKSHKRTLIRRSGCLNMFIFFLLTIGLATIEETKIVQIQEASAVKGAETSEWGAQMALWGLIPLWRAAPPPDTVLSLRRPTPSDCWPFSGSQGEVIINLPPKTPVNRVSIEHVWPDTARSAPKNFTIYGSLANGTWLKVMDGAYHNNLPAKQYYTLHYKNMFWKQIVFKILSNQGNPKYTCIYRFHLYKNEYSDLLNIV